MKTATKVLFALLPIAAVLVLATPTQAYFYQQQQRYQPQYRPQTQQPYQFFNYGNTSYDAVSPLIQSHLNFVQQLQYIPAPVHQYFYQYYTPYYYGY